MNRAIHNYACVYVDLCVFALKPVISQDSPMNDDDGATCIAFPIA